MILFSFTHKRTALVILLVIVIFVGARALGMIRDEEDIEGVIQVGRHMSTATGQPIRYIDIVLVKYGQMGRGD